MPARRILIGIILLFSSSWALETRAEIQIKTLPDGTKMISNESFEQRARRHASRLLPVPKADLMPLIDMASRHAGLSPRLVQAVIQVESGYNVRAVSNKGALGLMQLMPGTAALLGVKDPFDPDQNIRGGSTYLRQQLNRFDGDLVLALAAYNAGPGAVEQYGGVPPYEQTEDYVKRVLSLYLKNPPALAVDYPRDLSRARQEKTRTRVKAEAKQKGEKVYLVRDQNNQILLTTAPPTAAASSASIRQQP